MKRKRARGSLVGGVYVPKPKNDTPTSVPRDGRKKRVVRGRVVPILGKTKRNRG